MKRGRRKMEGIREWILDQLVDGPLTCMQLRRRFMKTNFCAVSHTLYSAITELEGCNPQFAGSEKRIHVVEYLVGAGRPQKVYGFGNFPDAPKPPPSMTRNAINNRNYYARQKQQHLADKTRIEIERRRALKRRPVMPELTARLFGLPIKEARK